MRRLAVLLSSALALAACGGGGPKPDHATLTGVDVRAASVAFTFDVRPDRVDAAYAPPRTLAECGSGLPIRPNGAAFAVVHFRPALTEGVPKRIVMPSGVVLDVWKVCDFEADVAWAIGVSHRTPVHVGRDGATVIISFG